MDVERRALLETLEAKQRRYRRDARPFAVLPEADLPTRPAEGDPLHRPMPPDDLCKRQ